MNEMTLMQLFNLGGWAMWPLLIFSVLALSIIIERIIYFLSHKLSTKETAREVIERSSERDYEGALEFCRNSKKGHIAPKVLAAGLKMRGMSEHLIEKAMETRAAEEINNMERGFNFLTAIGSLAPITGFLGTVSGMIGAFDSIARASDVNAQIVAGGIFEALITTAFGLCIGILAIAAYNVFSHFVDKFSAEIEMQGSDLTTNLVLHSGQQAYHPHKKAKRQQRIQRRPVNYRQQRGDYSRFKNAS